MRAVVTLLMGLLVISPASAFDRRVESWIVTCGNRDMCSDFRRDWKKAFRGDPDAQKNLTFYFSTGAGGAVKRDLAVGCAWEIVLLAARHPNTRSSEGGNLRHYCGRSAVGNLDRPIQIAMDLFAEIYRRSLPPPPWEWAAPVNELVLPHSREEALRAIETAARVSALCPGSSIDQVRVNAVLSRLGVDPREGAPGGAYDTAAIRDRVLQESGVRRLDGEHSCRNLTTYYGPLGLTVGGIANVPMAADYPD